MNNVFTEDSFSSKLRNIVQFECAVMLLENPQCLGLNFENFRPNVWEILNFELFFLVTGIPIQQNKGFGRKN